MSNSTALQTVSPALSEWHIIREQAAALVPTGFLPQHIKTPEQAMAIMLTGRELGIGPMAALNGINIIQGKPSVSPQLMLGMINSTREVDDIAIETSDAGAIVTIKRKGRTPYTARFGPKEAKAMGLDSKDNYKKQPATMYKWRAVADAARATFPDVIQGLYTPDELGAAVSDEGDMVTPPAVASIPVVPQEPEFDRKVAVDACYAGMTKLREEFKLEANAIEMRIAEAAQGEVAELEDLKDDQIKAVLESLRKWFGELSRKEKANA